MASNTDESSTPTILATDQSLGGTLENPNPVKDSKEKQVQRPIQSTSEIDNTLTNNKIPTASSLPTSIVEANGQGSEGAYAHSNSVQGSKDEHGQNIIQHVKNDASEAMPSINPPNTPASDPLKPVSERPVSIHTVQKSKNKANSLTSQSRSRKAEFETSSVKSRRCSARLREKNSRQALVSKLSDAIDLQTKVNSMVVKELNSKPKYERLQEINHELRISTNSVHSLHNDLKLVERKPEKTMIQKIDRFTHDINVVLEMVESAMSELCVRKKVKAPSVLSQTSGMSHQSRHLSSSHSSQGTRSSNAAQLRMKANDAAARIAEMETQLQTKLKLQQVEREFAELEREKKNKLEEINLHGEIEAERRKADVFMRALEEEEYQESGFMLPNHSKSRLMTIFDGNTNGSGQQHNEDKSYAKTSTEIGANINKPFQPTANQTTNQTAEKTHMQSSVGQRKVSLTRKSDDPDKDIDPQQELYETESEEEFNTSSYGDNTQTAPRQNSVIRPHVAQPVVRPSNSPQTSILETSQLTNGIAEAISSAITMSRLPPPEPFVFEGDPMVYPDWIIAFEGLIDSKPGGSVEKLHYLRRYVSGKAKEVVNGYFLIQNSDAYDKAKQALKKRFGNPYTIAEAFRSKIELWPKISSKNGEELRAFSDFCQQCLTAMESLPELKILDDNRENKKMLQKVPEWVSRKWVRYVTTYQQKHSSFPKFSRFAAFLAKEAEIACNTLLSDQKPKEPNKKQEKKTHVSLNTEVNSTSGDSENKTSSQDEVFCAYCDMKNHSTAICNKLGRLNFKDIQEFMKTKHLCFSCLKSEKHGYKTCPKPETCKVCKGNHPTSLHALRTSSKRDKPSNTQEQMLKSNEKQNNQYSDNAGQNVATHSMTTSSATTAKTNSMPHSHDNSLAWIVPVWVASKRNPNRETLVYALIDSMSDTTYITTDTVQKLNPPCITTSLNMTTMTSENKTLPCLLVPDLIVRAYSEAKWHDLPPAYSHKCLPFSRDRIPSKEHVQRWPHLVRVAQELPAEEQDIPIGMLIGFNFRKAFKPTEVVQTENDDEPFAIRTALGWNVMGNANPITGQATLATIVQHPTNRQVVTFKCTTNSSRELDKLIEMYSKEFSDAYNDTPDLSIDDKKFLDIMARETEFSKNRITMPLPFKAQPTQQATKPAALHRFKLLEKKFCKDVKYKELYHQFMHDIIAKGEAVLVDSEKGDTWYISHFGVFHPQKPGKIRVVFDCAAKVGGVSLNDFLLQGPEHINDLQGILLRFRIEPIAIMGDIERMFHQFKVSPSHQDYLRFLWYDSTGDIATYKMTVHLFGARSSPACATYGLRYIAEVNS